MSDSPDRPDYLRFAYPLPASILRGRKTATVRYDLDPDLSSGDRIDLRNEDGMVFAHATVVAAEEATVGDAREVIDDHGGRYTKDAGGIVSALNSYYDECITRETPVSVVVFEDISHRHEVESLEEGADL